MPPSLRNTTFPRKKYRFLYRRDRALLSFPLPRLLVYRNQCFMDHAPNVVPHGGMVHTQLLKLFSGRTSHKLSSEPDSRSLTAIH